MKNQDRDHDEDGRRVRTKETSIQPTIISPPPSHRHRELISIALIILILLGYQVQNLWPNRSSSWNLLSSSVRPDDRSTSSFISSLEFKSLSGFFIQDDPNQNRDQFQVYHPNSSFGLIDNISKARWINFQSKITKLVNHRPDGVDYKVIFIARHGQGYHNVAESKYGTPLWDCYWSEKTTDGNLVWGPDARLTSLGQAEARVAQRAWNRELRDHAPLPELFILSPLSRSIETMLITGVWKHYRSKLRPSVLVKEKWRENIGLHTCDKRRSRQEIAQDFGDVVEFEDGFTDLDLLWTTSLQETNRQLDNRILQAVTSVFRDPISRNRTYISITAHSGVISSLLRVVGHQPWPTETGGMIPLVIQAKPKKSPTRPPNPGPSATKPSCPISM